MFDSFKGNDLALFDIRLASPYKDIILLHGNENESASKDVGGSIVFSVADNSHANAIKKVSLRLTGTFNLNTVDKGHIRYIRQKKVMFLCYWDNLLVDSKGVILTMNGKSMLTDQELAEYFENSTTLLTSASDEIGSIRQIPRNKLSPSLLLAKKNHFHFRSHSSSSSFVTLSDYKRGTPFEELAHSSHKTFLESKNFILPKGNCELPFNCTIPGNIAETIEDLHGTSLSYNFEATITRASPPNLLKASSAKISKTRQVRVFRTLSDDLFLAPQDLLLSNTWASKIQYMVDVPLRYVPIGSKVLIKIKLIPLTKGLRLNKILTKLNEIITFQSHDNLFYTNTYPIAAKAVTPSLEEESYALNEQNLSGVQIDSGDKDTEIQLNNDSWVITTHLEVPRSLAKVSQDCDVAKGIVKVRHQLKLKVALLNPNHRLSELRANLPIVVYVNPQVPIQGKDELSNLGEATLQPEWLFGKLEDQAMPSPSALDTQGCEFGLPSSAPPPGYASYSQDPPYNPNTELMLANASGQQTSASTISSENEPLSFNNLSKVPSYRCAVESYQASCEVPPIYVSRN